MSVRGEEKRMECLPSPKDYQVPDHLPVSPHASTHPDVSLRGRTSTLLGGNCPHLQPEGS